MTKPVDHGAAREYATKYKDTLKNRGLCNLSLAYLDLEARVEKLEKVRACAEHALEIGYLGDGSTANWMRQALGDIGDA